MTIKRLLFYFVVVLLGCEWGEDEESEVVVMMVVEQQGRIAVGNYKAVAHLLFSYISSLVCQVGHRKRKLSLPHNPN